MDELEWEKMFNSVELTVHQVETIKEVTQGFKKLGALLQNELPTDGQAGRYKAMVKSKLEEAAMLANKCISRTEEF